MLPRSSGACWQPMAEYRLTPAAESDLEAIWIYTSKKWSNPQADLYIDALTDAFGDLAQSPLRAPSCEQIKPDYRRWGIGTI